MKELLSIIMLVIGFGCFNVHADVTAAEVDAPYLVLSAETNGLKSGLYIGNTNHVLVLKQGKLAVETYFAMLNTTSNDVQA